MMCAELGGPRGRWPLQWRGEGWVGRASEEETVPYGGHLGTGDFDSGAEEGSLPPDGAGAGGGGERSVQGNQLQTQPCEGAGRQGHRTECGFFSNTVLASGVLASWQLVYIIHTCAKLGCHLVQNLLLKGF